MYLDSRKLRPITFTDDTFLDFLRPVSGEILRNHSGNYHDFVSISYHFIAFYFIVSYFVFVSAFDMTQCLYNAPILFI
jgi:hypothetical protein